MGCCTMLLVADKVGNNTLAARNLWTTESICDTEKKIDESEMRCLC